MDEYCGCVAAIVNGALQPEGGYWAIWAPGYFALCSRGSFSSELICGVLRFVVPLFYVDES